TKPGELHIAHSIKGEAIVEIFFNVKDEFGGTVRISEARVWDQYHRANTVDLSAAVIKMLPKTFALKQNYPNPFNPTTSISFSIPQAMRVELAVFDILGRQVAKLVSGNRMAGTHTVAFDGAGLSSGMYVFRLNTESSSLSRTMILLK
ncbi:T9SS type A sorting domain-containing protein, partial [bacterium]|nr:T9SS type A sorting domain-containing protein [bacterium]